MWKTSESRTGDTPLWATGVVVVLPEPIDAAEVTLSTILRRSLEVSSARSTTSAGLLEPGSDGVVGSCVPFSTWKLWKPSLGEGGSPCKKVPLTVEP